MRPLALFIILLLAGSYADAKPWRNSSIRGPGRSARRQS
jgi:hypothetical protein